MFNIAKALTTAGAVGVGSVFLKNQECLKNVMTLHAYDKESSYVGDIVKRKVGFPQPTACCKPLRFKEFVISYDSRNRIPNWVYEHLNAANLFNEDPCTPHKRINRSDCASKEDKDRPKFTPDCRIHGYHRADAKDYCDTEYEMGLMANPENYPYCQEAYCESFTMTNVVPHVPGFSCGPWYDLENYVRDKLVKNNKSVYICSGPLFLPVEDGDKLVKCFDVLGDGEVSVPTHFFKVIVVETEDGRLELETYMVPNAAGDGNDTNLDEWLTPLCQIEHHSGLIFFPDKKCFSSNNKRRGAKLHAL